jgi:hypothetical protein
MASYLGNNLESIIKVRKSNFRFVATAGQDRFTGVDSNGLTLALNIEDTEVFLNGVLLDQTDYVITSPSIIDLAVAAAANDILEVITNNAFSVLDSYTKSEIDDIVSTAINNLIANAPGALDTLNELAAALGDDANFAATITSALADKITKTANTGSANIPVGTTAQRDGTPAQGYFRFNSSTNQFEGYNGTAWGAVGGGATGGANNPVFYENDQTVTVNYSITSGKNAMTAGPVTIADGVNVTIPDGSTWTIV